MQYAITEKDVRALEFKYAVANIEKHLGNGMKNMC
jgi:hypothetical protein